MQDILHKCILLHMCALVVDTVRKKLPAGLPGILHNCSSGRYGYDLLLFTKLTYDTLQAVKSMVGLGI